MSLTEKQQRALEHARDVLAELPATPRLPEEWRLAVVSALAEVAAAFGDEDPSGGAS